MHCDRWQVGRLVAAKALVGVWLLLAVAIGATWIAAADCALAQENSPATPAVEHHHAKPSAPGGAEVAGSPKSAAAETAVAEAAHEPQSGDLAKKPEKTIRLLVVGNSFSQNATKYLEQIVKADGRYELIIRRLSIGGAGFEQHWQHVAEHEADATTGRRYGGKSLKEILAEEKWDIVTVQQNSIASFKVETYRPHAKNLVEYIRRHAPQAEVWMHQTWAYRADDTETYRDGVTPETMYEGLRQAYHTISAEVGIRNIIPVGDAFWKATNHPDWQFKFPDPAFDYKKPVHPALPDQRHSLHLGWWWKKGADGTFALIFDTHHASRAGEYLGSAVWFERLFGVSVVGNSFVPEGVAAEDVKFLQKIAHETVSDKANTEPQAAAKK